MKAKKALILLLAMLFTVLQCSLLDYLRIFRVKPDMLLVLVAFCSLFYGRFYALAVGALCGLFAEATSAIPAGLAVFIYAWGGLLLAHLARLVYRQKVFGQILISFAFTFLVYLSFFFSFRVLGMAPDFWKALFLVILPASVYTAGVAPFLFYFLKTVFDIR